MLDDVALICELDAQWAYVGNKQHRHWLWYAFDTKRKRVVAYTFGPRNDETCRRLLSLLSPFQIGFITSDDWGKLCQRGAERDASDRKDIHPAYRA